jgi:iron complex transport system substrate-binding protein
MLFAMGAGPQVIGVSSHDTYPPEVRTRPAVGALVDPDFERILALRPDLVIVYGSQTNLIGRLERLRVPLFFYEHAGLADITETILKLGVRVGRESTARRLAAEMTASLDQTRRSVAGRARPRTALVFGREAGTLRGIYVSAGVGFMHDMLVAAGGDDAFADVRRQSLQVSSETLLARGPQMIIEVRAGTPWPAARMAEERRIWWRLPALPAVRANQVHLLFDDRLWIPGPRVPEGVRLLADLLHPGAR